MIPNVPGLLAYRKYNKHVYVNEGSKWQALGNEEEVSFTNAFAIIGPDDLSCIHCWIAGSG